MVLLWLTVLVAAGAYLYASYQLALVRTPPWWVKALGAVPYDAFVDIGRSLGTVKFAAR